MLQPTASESPENQAASETTGPATAGNRALALRPSSREFYTGLAILTVLAGVTMMRGGRPQAGFAAGEVREPAVRDYRSRPAANAAAHSMPPAAGEDEAPNQAAERSR